MGYTLTIGQLETSWNTDDGLESTIRNSARGEHLKTAPAYGEPTDHTNSRWPSYSAWHNFAEFVGLKDFFYSNETGLLRKHPGCIPLSEKHKEIVDKAYKDFYEKYPNAKAGYSQKQLEDSVGKDKDWPDENIWAARLEWLKFWIDWALENCDKPVFYNS